MRLVNNATGETVDGVGDRKFHRAEDGWRVQNTPPAAEVARLDKLQKKNDREAEVRAMGEHGRFDFLVKQIQALEARIVKLEKPGG